jgi:hypothetical protein
VLAGSSEGLFIAALMCIVQTLEGQAQTNDAVAWPLHRSKHGAYRVMIMTICLDTGWRTFYLCVLLRNEPMLIQMPLAVIR